MQRGHRVVIAGGGFAGLTAAKALAGEAVDITLLDRRNFHLFQPLLYQVATGALSPADIASPLRYILRYQKNCRVLLDEVTDFHLDEKKVILRQGEAVYDTLLVAAGAENFYFGNDRWQECAPALKSLEDATQMRGRILSAFESAETETDMDRRLAWLTFVVVGAGPTGVELAGALGEIARETLRKDFRSIHPEMAQIILIDGSPRVLPSYPEPLSRQAERDLIQLGVRSRTGLRVVDIGSTGVTVEGAGGREHIAARTVLWAAGVRAASIGATLARRAGVEADRGGRLPVRPGLTLEGHPDVLVLGDLARFEQDGKPLPGIAPVAMQQGRYAAALVRARLRGAGAGGGASGQPAIGPFRYVDKGNLATIGRHSAVADIRGWQFHGLPAWLLWLFIHLMYLVGFRNRLLVFMQWAIQYVSFNRHARLISGPDAGSAAAPAPRTVEAATRRDRGNGPA